MGVSAPTMRQIAREVHGRVKSQTTALDAVAVCDELLSDPRQEVKLTALVFLSRFVRKLEATIFGNAKRWIESDWCQSWAVIDELCGDILGPLLVREHTYFRLVRSWHKSGDMWLRRAAMVVLIKPARRGLLLDEAYHTAGKLLNEPEDLVQKAVGWLLREAGKTDLKRLESFLFANSSHCARTTFRYAIERFPEATRKRLLKA
jgi:3-methyladenine DNA glycosylase AlkD